MARKTKNAMASMVSSDQGIVDRCMYAKLMLDDGVKWSWWVESDGGGLLHGAKAREGLKLRGNGNHHQGRSRSKRMVDM